LRNSVIFARGNIFNLLIPDQRMNLSLHSLQNRKSCSRMHPSRSFLRFKGMIDWSDAIPQFVSAFVEQIRKRDLSFGEY
jgi:hypothetical protein